jgi:hypothetical protein
MSPQKTVQKKLDQGVNEMKPHKHAELIKAWADGAEIQYRYQNFIDWYDIENPNWDVTKEYRIKPAEKVVRWLWGYKNQEGFYVLTRFFTESEADRWFDNVPHKKLEWSREEFDE